MNHSFSKKGCPYDNACIESFHATLKKEEIHHVKYMDFNTAKITLFQCIEGWVQSSQNTQQFRLPNTPEVEDKLLMTA